MNDHCNEHSGVCKRMDRAERDIQKLFDAIDRMKYWVIAGMGSMLISGIAFIVNLLAG